MSRDEYAKLVGAARAQGGAISPRCAGGLYRKRLMGSRP
jgi:hypothetical protein